MKKTMFVYFPKFKEFLYATEGTGDNLLSEDIDEGYVDYVYIESYKYSGDNGDLEETDGGQMLMKDLFVDVYANDDGTQLISDAAEFLWDIKISPEEYVVIEEWED